MLTMRARLPELMLCVRSGISFKELRNTVTRNRVNRVRDEIGETFFLFHYIPREYLIHVFRRCFAKKISDTSIVLRGA